MAERKRGKNVNIRLTDEEFEMLTAVATHGGLTLSDWIRQSFRQAFRKLFGAKKKPE
jgi:uncharacterized protein (DUF1778 family)